MSSVITLGLSQIKVGNASTAGTMPNDLTKIGKTYKDSCQITQDASDVTEHFEEGHAAPEVRKKTKKMPIIKFSLMDCDVDALVQYIGGTKDASTQAWNFDGSSINSNKAIRIETEQGLDFDIPNADIEAVINAQLTSSGIFLVEFTVTPMAVDNGKAIVATPKGE